MPKSSETKLKYNAEYAKNTGYAAQLKFNKEGQTRFNIAFGKGDDDVIAKLQSVDNRTDYVRQLIRADLAKN